MTVRRAAAAAAAAAAVWAGVLALGEATNGNKAACLPFEAQCCHINPARDPSYDTYSQNPQYEVPGWEVLDLDLPPTERWAALVKPAAAGIKTMFDHFKGMLGSISAELFKLLEDSERFKRISTDVLDSLGDYGAEMRGIAQATGMLEEDILFYNMMYEIEGGCTSIVAQDAEGNVVHGRNLDFGLLFGEDWRHFQWKLTEDLRPILRNVRVKQGGKVVFNSTVFLGYTGLLSGAKKGGFSISVNTRYDWHHAWHGLLDYLEGKDRTGHFLSLTMRDVMITNSSYAEALHVIQSAKLLGPAYVIIGGTKPGEGAIVARNGTGVVGQWLLADAAKAGRNSIVQTNWDIPHDPVYDNRRAPAEHCLRERFNQHIDFRSLFQVLSAHPNRNRLTTYTALMRPQTGDFEAYLQYCDEPLCAPWMEQMTANSTLVV